MVDGLVEKKASNDSVSDDATPACFIFSSFLSVEFLHGYLFSFSDN